MEHPVKTAPCPLLFAANGGRFNQLGLPVFNTTALDPNDPEDAYVAATNCDRAYDCGVCPLLIQWIDARIAEGWNIGWECTKCLNDSFTFERDNPDVERKLAGYYQAGRDPMLTPDDEDYDPDRPPLTGCTSCGWGSSFLQLVLRRQRPR
jgi:hypothetical protein